MEPNVLVALLAVRALGGRSVPASHEVVKALKKTIQQAVANGLLKEDTLTEQVPVEGKKKPKTVKTKVVALTEEGERVLRASASAEALAATQARAVAAEVEALRRGLDADRDALKQQVQAALGGKGKDKGDKDYAKQLGELAKKVGELSARLEKLEGTQPKGGSAEALAAKIDEGFAALLSRLDRALQGLPKPAAHHPAPAAHHASPPIHLAPKPAPPPTHPAPAQQQPPAAPDTLQGILRKAYDELKAHYREYQEGMVELPRLYHEARQARPDLTVADFHRELLALEGQRLLDLHIRNEVRDAPEPEKAIRRNDKLYYFVYWPRS